MSIEQKQKLVDLGAEALSEALLTLAGRSDDAVALIERLISTPNENIQLFKKGLSSLSRSGRFFNWHSSDEFAQELEMLLENVEAGADDPLTGIELLAAFYEADDVIFEMCDDSSGTIGDLFSTNAAEMFAEYASHCDEKEKIADIILRLMEKDEYGVRDGLIHYAGRCVPERVIRSMIATLQGRADQETADHKKRHHLLLVESLARQIKDAELFEKTRLASRGKHAKNGAIDIARAYLESGDVETAHSRLKEIPEGAIFHAYERDELLLEIYKRQGESGKLADLLFQEFRSFHSVDTLQAFLDVAGNDKRDEVIREEIVFILENDTLRGRDAEFLIAIGEINEAEAYLLKRADQLNGDLYGMLLTLAKSMESDNRFLTTSLIYRSLLASILKRGYSKDYSHGVRYLRKLDKLAAVITDWKDFDHHEQLKEQIVREHGRKRSFWSKYEAK